LKEVILQAKRRYAMYIVNKEGVTVDELVYDGTRPNEIKYDPNVF
jgi:hypothetical protein